MTSSDDDEELKQAIALSLAETQPAAAPPSPTNVIGVVSSDNDDDDDDDDNLRQAIALSLRQTEREKDTSPAAHSIHDSEVSHPGHTIAELKGSPPTQAQPTSDTGQASGGIMGLDRKAMEQERLARLGKRKRTPSPERPSQRKEVSDERIQDRLSDQPRYFKRAVGLLSWIVAEDDSHEDKTSDVSTTSRLVMRPSLKATADEGNGDTSTDQSPVQYPHGAIKRTWAFKHPRTNDIKIEELLQTSTLSIAVLSAFQWDDRWLFSKLDTAKVKQIWIMNAKGEDLQEKLLAEATEAKIPNLKPHFPPMSGQIMNMHSKLMLLFHPTHLRIAVPTANMTKVDWGETEKDVRTGESWQSAVMENSVFLIDLPRRSDGEVGGKNDATSFGRGLIEYLEAQEVGRRVTEGVLKFDFANTKDIEFVHAIGGSHTGQSSTRTGLPGLSNALRRLGLDQVREIELDYATSSLGALKDSFLKQLYIAASGEPPLSNREVPADFLDRIRIYFPSRDTVVTSTGGPACGGIITLGRKQYGAAFPKQCMREYRSTRKGVLSHNKILLARGRKKDNRPFAWAYVGSANLTESAWGTQKMLKSGKEGVLSIRNWECGVVVAVPDEKLKELEELEVKDGAVPPMTVFEGTLEVPFQYPGDKYEGKEPWFFMEEQRMDVEGHGLVSLA